MTGLLPLLQHYEHKFEEIAGEIEAAGGDGEKQEKAEQAVQEPPKSATPEERIAGYKRVIDLCTTWIREAEAQIVGAA